MLKINKNHLKSLVLAILVIASLMQLGFLWDYQNYGIPLSFLSGSFSSSGAMANTDISGIIKEELFKANSITISNGNETHWILTGKSQEWKKLMVDGAQYLRTAAATKEGEGVSLSLWDDIILRKGIKVDFIPGLNLELLHWILDIKSTDGYTGETVTSIVFLPDEDINNNNTMYIHTSERLTKYVIPFLKGGFTNKDFNTLIQNLERNTETIGYKYFAEIDPNGVIGGGLPFHIPRDNLCVVYGKRTYLFHQISHDMNMEGYNIEELARIFVGSEKESYDRYVEKNATVFRNINNTYRLNNDGFLEYRYLAPIQDNDKTDIGSALEIVYSYITGVANHLELNDSEFFLKTVDSSNSGYYEFIFDYIVDGAPVYLDLKGGSRVQKPYEAAIIVKANSKRIVDLKWHIFKINKSKLRRGFNIYFTDMLDDFFKKYKDEDYFNTRLIKPAYLLTPDKGRDFNPVWIMDDFNEFRYVYLKER